MGVEGGGISAGGGPVVGAFGGEFGPNIGIGSTIVNEGPKAAGSLEHTMPLTLNNFNSTGEIIFNPATSVLNQAEEVADAAWKVSEPAPVVKQAEQVAARAWEIPLASQGPAWEATRVSEVSWTRSAPSLSRGLDVRVITNPFGTPKEESAPQTIVQTRAESKATSAVARATSTPIQKEVQTEQIVEEKKVLTEEEQEDKPQAKKNEKQSVAKIKIVEAVKVTQLRRSAISEAARKVKEEAEKAGERVVITGKKLKKFLSAELWKYISPLVGRGGYDGTIPLTLNAIEKNQTEYTNLEAAQTRLSQPVAEHIPLEKGEGGRVATVEEVREVLEGKEKEAIKSQAPAEIMVIRLVRENNKVASTGQVVNTVVEEKEEVAGEPTLKDLGLEEIFQKAA